MSPSNYFNTLRGAWSDFYGPSGLLQFGLSCLLKLRRLGPSCLGPTFFMGRLVLGRLVFGPGCPEPDWTMATLYGTMQRRCSAVNRKTVYNCFLVLIFALKPDFFVKNDWENNVNICNKGNLFNIH